LNGNPRPEHEWPSEDYFSSKDELGPGTSSESEDELETGTSRESEDEQGPGDLNQIATTDQQNT